RASRACTSTCTSSRATPATRTKEKGSEQFSGKPAIPEAPRRIGELAGGEPDGAGARGRELVGRRAVKVRGEHERRFAAQALREERAEDSREHVAHPGARHAGVAGGVDEEMAVARDQHAAVTLERRVRVVALRDRACRGDAVVLYFGNT